MLFLQNMTVNQISAKQLKVFKLNNTVSAPTTIEKKYDINILPNPAREETTALISQPGPSDFQLTISDLSGRVLMVKTIRHIQAGQKHSIKTGSLNKGTYIIEISDNKNRYVEKLVIE
ncbi:MAG: T9SS type A sorting domain-containing protein [Bacteroidales bacterium]